jgi:recombination associated protein RdgC
MFKTLSLFRIAGEWRPTLEQLKPSIEKNEFVECGATQIQSVGWIPPRGEKHGELIESIDGQLILTLCIQTKLLPSAVVREALDKRLDQIEQSTGRRPGKKEQREIKEQVILELLPPAFTKKEHITIWIDRKNQLIAMDTTSNTKTDAVTKLLVTTINGLALALVQTEVSPSTAMKNWLLDGEAPGQLVTGREVELKSSDESRSAVKYTRHLLDIDEIREHLTGGKSPTRLSMTWADLITFELTESLALKKVAFLETPLLKKKKGGDDPFDANVAIVTGELSKLIPELIEALGGEMEFGAAGDAEEGQEVEQREEALEPA